MLDILLPILDAEYPALYPIGIKASCVCRYVRRDGLHDGEGNLTFDHFKEVGSTDSFI